MNRVTKHILLGGAGDVSDPSKFENIDAVLSCCPLRELEYEVPSGMKYCRISINDEEEIDDRNLNRAMNFISDCVRNDQQILVHCYGGVSRSPSIVACYLSLSLGVPFQLALNFVQECRSGVDPHKDIISSVNEYVVKNSLNLPLPLSLLIFPHFSSVNEYAVKNSTHLLV